MTTDPLAIIEAAFGWREFPHAMFYRVVSGLRFELGDNLEMGPLRFMQALNRATAVANALFSKSETLHVVVSIDGQQRTTKRHSGTLRKLQKIGFRHPFGPPTKIPQNDAEHIAAFGSDHFRHWYVSSFAHDEASISALIWASVAREMEIWPKARWASTIHIADLRSRLALTAYDDRGMDVIGPSVPALLPLYSKCGSWLFDYDRARMDAVFSA